MLVVACAGKSPPEFTAVPVSVADEDLSELVQAALQADALLEIPDSLYTDEATVVSDGVERLAAPRFAGVGLGGSVAVTSTRFEVRSGVAWAYVAYRWMSEGGSEVREGRATIVLLVTSGAWRIRHAHSSTPGEARPGGV
jgi:hypothetical protein